VKLMLLLAMTGSAAADGWVASVRAGTAFVAASPNDHGFGELGAIEGGYQLGRFRGSLALDLTLYEETSGDTHASWLLESPTAKLQVDIISDLVFAFVALGTTVTSHGPDTVYSFRYQAGVGGRVWLSHDNAIRLDASFAHDHNNGQDLGEYGVALGYEHYF
jgi:hypothetical protein